MLQFQLSLLPFLVIAVVNFFLGWLWYSPILFLKPWAKALGFTLPMVMTEADKKAMPGQFLGVIVGSLLFSYGLQVVVHSAGATTFVGGIVVGVVAWATFAVTHSLSTLFEGRKPVVLVINNGLYLLTYALFGGLVAVWR